jgi:predicted ester cyclase
MSSERTRQVMNRYWDSDHKDVSMMADDVVFTHMASGEEHRGPDGVRRMLDYMYRQAFTATADTRTRVCTEDHAMIEGDFVGTHTGEFAGIPATGRQVRVPFCVVYDLTGDRVTRGRVYMEMPVMMRQLGGAAQPAAAAHA